ncbi:AraC family transcriptional regulator [Paenibacillus sp. HJGM_3]|uniref:AraC family transcriptional regulator n=1 Tax=Paenibacillus sp. HJGM_3 TaxID=3379816 RepID=UPI00385B6DF6
MSFMRRNWFYRLMLSYIPVFLAVCLTLLLILFLTVRQLSERSSIQSNETVARNASQMLEQSLRGIDDGMFLLVNSNSDIEGFYAETSSDSFVSAYRTALALSNLQTRFPLIVSLYLVNPEKKIVLEPTSIAESDLYADKAYIEAQMQSDTRFRWGDRRKLASPSSPQGTREVISIARIANLRTKGLLVSQVDVNELQKLLSQSVDTSVGYIRIADGNGRLIGSTIPADETGKERKRLATVTMSYTGWTIESGVLQPGILGWAEPALYISISLGGLCMLIGGVWFVLASRRHYRPVQGLLSQVGAIGLKRPLDPPQGGRRDEFQTIGRALDHLWDDSNRLKLENEANRKFKRVHHFLRLAEGRFDAASFYGQREEELFGLRLDAGRPTAVIVELDRYAAFFGTDRSEEELQAMRLALQGQLDLTLADTGCSFTSEWLYEHQLGAIVMQGEAADAEIGLIAGLEQLRAWVEKELPCTVTIAAGVAVDRIESVSVSFQTARRALGYKLSLGSNRLIPLHILPDRGQPELILELERIEEISRSLRMGETEWEAELTQLSASLTSHLFGGEQVRNLLYVLLFHIQHKMSDLPAELDGYWQSANERLMQSLKEGESLAEISAALRGTLSAVSEQIRLWRDSRQNRSAMQEVKRYIDEHYFDPGLSQSLLGDAFRLHPSSISRLFKEEYGVKFVDYVNSLRIEKAIELMEQEEYPVHVLAEKVGFMHSKTFIQVFKKHTGTTPGMYRKERTGT